MRFLFFFFFLIELVAAISIDSTNMLSAKFSLSVSLSLSTFSKRGTKRFAKCEICIGDYGWSGSSGKSCLAALSALPSSDIDHRHSRKFRCNRKYLYTVISPRVYIVRYLPFYYPNFRDLLSWFRCSQRFIRCARFQSDWGWILRSISDTQKLRFIDFFFKDVSFFNLYFKSLIKPFIKIYRNR